MELSKARREATRVTVVGMILDIALGLGKIVGGLLTQSFALVTDGIHSLSDAATDVFVLLVARFAHAEPDTEHPYGHGRFETLGTVGMGIVFFITAGIILYDSVMRLRDPSTLPTPQLAGAAIAAISIAGKEWIYHYTMRVANKLNSSLLKANAWHSRTDAISSIAVLVGLVAAQQGYPWMDTAAAAFVALIIAKVGWELCADSLRELVDTAVSPARQQQLRECILSVEGIRGITELRSRLSGGKMMLEVHLLVSPRISVSEGHQLGELVRRKLIGRFSDISEVLTHIDSENHDPSAPESDGRSDLPERQWLLDSIRERWQNFLSDKDIERVALHYLETGIEVDLMLQIDELPSITARQLTEALTDLNCIARLRIYHKHHDAQLTLPVQ